MLTHPIAAALLLGGSASAAARPQGPPRKLSPRQFQRELYGSSPRASALRKKFLHKATFVGGRQLSADDDAFKSWADAQYQKGSAWYSNYANQADDGGDAYEAEDEEQQEYEYGAMQQQYGFAPSSYALSYHRCAAVQQYDDKVAASDNTDDVFATKNFAVFRFCPAATCDAEIVVEEDGQDGGRRRRLEEAAEDADAEQADGEAQEYDFEYPEYGARGRGCNKNYGEYLLSLEDFLQMMTEDQQERLEGYCDFCDDYMYDMYVDQCVNSGNCRHRNMKFETFKEDRELQRELGFNYGICAEVPYVCHDTLDMSLTEYFECTEAGGMYVGPHCGADGFSVTLGVYADEECNKYVGGDVADYIGQDVDEDDLMKWYNSRHGVLDFLYEGEEESLCISCARKVSRLLRRSQGTSHSYVSNMHPFTLRHRTMSTNNCNMGPTMTPTTETRKRPMRTKEKSASSARPSTSPAPAATGTSAPSAAATSARSNGRRCSFRAPSSSRLKSATTTNWAT